MTATQQNNKPVLWLTFPLAVLVIVASLVPLGANDFYAGETINWQAQSIGQDMVNLYLVVPCLVVSAWLASRNKKGFLFIWAGVVTYLLYTFIIYCFAVHFNQLFLVFCMALGLSFFSLVWFFGSHLKNPGEATDFREVPRKLTGINFLALAVVFYFLWLSEIIPAVVSNEIPKSVEETGLITNAVHVIDLSVFLPAVLISGIFLLRRKTIGFIMAPLLLTFFILMNITIAWLVVLMKQRGAGGEYPVAIAMAVLGLFSLVLLIIYIKKMK